MALIEPQRRPSPTKIRPLPVLAATIVTGALFILVISVVARLTADGSSMAALHPEGVVVVVVVDAGVPDAAPPDAGMEALVTVSIDAGPTQPARAPTVDGPPFSASEVAAAAVVVVEACAVEALRWDPSLGGPFSLFVNLPVGAPPAIVVDDLSSPVLTSCLARRTAELALPPSFHGAALVVALGVSARATLDAAGRVTWSDAVVVSGRSL